MRNAHTLAGTRDNFPYGGGPAYSLVYKVDALRPGMLGLEAWLRARGLSRPKFGGLGLEGPGLGLEGPGLGLGFEGPGLGLSFEGPGLSLEGPGLGFEGPGLSFEGSGLGFEGPDLGFEGSGHVNIPDSDKCMGR